MGKNRIARPCRTPRLYYLQALPKAGLFCWNEFWKLAAEGIDFSSCFLYTDFKLRFSYTKASAIMEQQVVYIEVLVGILPEWYNEAEHDYALEQAIEKMWHRNPAYQDAEVRTTYGYNGSHRVTAYNDDGDKIFERECDLDGVFQAVYDAEVAPYV